MTEDILIWAAQKGSQKAFKSLFDKHYNSVYYFLLQFSEDRDEVDDWSQTTFIQAFENLEGFKRNSKFSTWLISIGLNVMRRAKGVYFGKMRSDLNAEIHDTEVQPDHDFEWKHDMKWLLKNMDEQKKAVFILYEVEEFSHSEISNALGISESNSKVILNRTKKLLREKWKKEEKL